MNPQLYRIIPLLLLLALTSMMAMGLFNSKDPQEDFRINQPIPDFDIEAMTAQPMLFSPDVWKYRVAVVNVFATWCEPCAVEHPALMKLARQGVVGIYGIAWKDSRDKVEKWLAARGNPYQLVGIDSHGYTTLPLALTGAPETFIVDKRGRVRSHFSGPLTDEIVNTRILPLVERLNAQPDPKRPLAQPREDNAAPRPQNQ